MVENSDLVVVPTLIELFGEDEPQEETAVLPAISLPFSLLVLLPKVSDLGILAGLAFPVVALTSAAPPLLLSLAPHYRITNGDSAAPYLAAYTRGWAIRLSIAGEHSASDRAV